MTLEIKYKQTADVSKKANTLAKPPQLPVLKASSEQNKMWDTKNNIWIIL